MGLGFRVRKAFRNPKKNGKNPEIFPHVPGIKTANHAEKTASN
jgi:hypothetical protein